MLLFHAVVLGIVQGLTEFLPVSSSGHLILVREVFGWELLADDHLNKMFDVALHAATFCALAVYFRSDLARLARAFAASLRGGLAGDVVPRLLGDLVRDSLGELLRQSVVGEEDPNTGDQDLRSGWVGRCICRMRCIGNQECRQQDGAA